MNIQLNYLFRDAENYKVFGSVIFKNNTGLSCSIIEKQIKNHLIEGEFFEAAKWGIPDLFIINKNIVDHGWCEFEGVEETNKEVNEELGIESFLIRITQKKPL